MPPKEIARLRDLTRYRTKLTQERARETQRIQKLLEDAGIKLDSVATDVLGKACRRTLEALIAGERDPEVLAQMALTRMRPKIPELRKAMFARFEDHHALLLRMHLDHVDQLSAIVERLDTEVDRLMAPFAEAATRLLSIPGVAKRSAEAIVAEDRRGHVSLPDRRPPRLMAPYLIAAIRRTVSPRTRAVKRPLMSLTSASWGSSGSQGEPSALNGAVVCLPPLPGGEVVPNSCGSWRLGCTVSGLGPIGRMPELSQRSPERLTAALPRGRCRYTGQPRS